MPENHLIQATPLLAELEIQLNMFLIGDFIVEKFVVL
jgi:hypothetical protein